MYRKKERILKAAREKGQVTYKGRPIRITPYFLTEILKPEDPGQMSCRSKRSQMANSINYYTQQNYQLQFPEKEKFHDKNKFIQFLLIDLFLHNPLEGKN